MAHHSHGKIQTRYSIHYNESHPCSTSAIPYSNAIIHDDKDDVTPSSLHSALTLAAPIQSDPTDPILNHPTTAQPLNSAVGLI